ncbi:centromere protein H (CENP-H)-domain-containing protein [Aspergillus californicus]
MSSSKARSLPHLSAGEAALLDLAADDPRDAISLSETEAMILKLYDQAQEQQLEKAFLEQDSESVSTDDAEDLAVAERELLEARATYTVRKKAADTVLMTDPMLKAVHWKALSPAERGLFRLANRRDIISLAQENMTEVENAIKKKISAMEVENMKLHQRNKDLVRELLEVTGDEETWRKRLDDDELEQQLAELETEYTKSRARYETLKNICSAMIVGSGVDWADDEDLAGLVLDNSADY